MSVRDYIKRAENKYANWTGGNIQPASTSRFASYTGVPVGANQMRAADSGGQTAQSQPYIITISNASATTVSSFDVLGAYTYINNPNFTNGSLTISNVTISSAIANVTYQQFLYQSMNQPFSVGLTYIEATGGTNASQITTTFTLNTQDANGNQMLRTIVPTIDPYQQQSTIVAVKQLYAIDGFTKITFAQIYPSAAFRVHFYPATNVNLASGLTGASVTQSYSNPNLFGVPTSIIG